MIEDKEKTITENIIQAGVEQIEKACRVSMDYELRAEVYTVAQSMREALGLRARLGCDWPDCGVESDGSESFDTLINAGWLHHHVRPRGKTHDLCPEHAAPFRERKWQKVRESRWQES